MKDSLALNPTKSLIPGQIMCEFRVNEHKDASPEFQGQLYSAINKRDKQIAGLRVEKECIP